MNESKSTLRKNGNLGLEIVSPNGIVIVWTTKEIIGILLCDFFNTNDNAASIIEAITNN